MSDLQIHLLGTFQILQNGRSLTTFRTNKIRALLAYLAVEVDHAHRRESLATLFWPQMDTRKALANLRLSLHRLHQVLGDDPPLLQVDRHTVRWNTAPTQVDALSFIQALTSVSIHTHTTPSLCPDCARRLETAVAQYRGDFLAGFFLGDSIPFDDWAASWRERLHQDALQTLAWLSDYHQENGRYPQAIPYARRQLELAPWREVAHYQLMQLLAAAGQYTAALQQYEQCRRLLRDELGLEPDAQTNNLLQQIQAEASRAPVYPEKRAYHIRFSAAARIITFLPSAAAPFIGRHAELIRLDDILRHPPVQMVTITGAGGIGKTRLALTWSATQAARYPEHFPDGVYFVPLAAIDAAANLAPAIAHTVMPLSDIDATAETTTQQLRDFLQNRQLLLVLDNFEQLLHGGGGQMAVTFLQDLCHHAHRLKLLVTSRERLGLQDEYLLPLDGLPCPDNNEAEGDQFPAAQLFIHCVRRIQPNFTLAPADRPHLAAICHLLDGIPLALELAAAWVEWLPLAEIVADIEDSLDFLTTGLHDWPERHRSMRTVFDRSWAQLSRPEQEFFMRLALFRGGFTRAAALAVAGTGLALPDVLRLLTTLANKSLLHYHRLEDRYAMHEMLRQYGAEKLAQAPSAASIQQAHAAYYCRWLYGQERELKGARQRETRIRIAAEMENISAAWIWAAQAGMLPFLAEASAALGLFLRQNGRFAEGSTFFAAVIEHLPPEAIPARLWYWRAIFEPVAAQQQAYLAHSLDLLSVAAKSGPADSADKAAVLLALGVLARRRGDWETAAQHFRQSLTLARLAGNDWGESNVLYELGVQAWRSGAYPQAEQWFARCLEGYRRLGDTEGEAVALEGLVGATLFSGQVEQALVHLRHSYALYEHLPDPLGIARLKTERAQISWFQNLEGLTLFEEGLADFRQLGDRRETAKSTAILAMLLADVDIQAAAVKATEAAALCQTLGERRGAAIAQGVLSRAALVDGCYPAAAQYAAAYEQTARVMALPVELTEALIWAGWAALALGDDGQAMRCAVEALQIPTYWQGMALDLKAVLLARRSTVNYKLAWQILGYGESRYARHRSPVSQAVCCRFLPPAMLAMPPHEIARLKEQGFHLESPLTNDVTIACSDGIDAPSLISGLA
jgi:predicted ATPase/DNA-binding SARP family transcriptional activator